MRTWIKRRLQAIMDSNENVYIEQVAAAHPGGLQAAIRASAPCYANFFCTATARPARTVMIVKYLHRDLPHGCPGARRDSQVARP